VFGSLSHLPDIDYEAPTPGKRSHRYPAFALCVGDGEQEGHRASNVAGRVAQARRRMQPVGSSPTVRITQEFWIAVFVTEDVAGLGPNLPTR
jgi:hypothetical protein